MISRPRLALGLGAALLAGLLAAGLAMPRALQAASGDGANQTLPFGEINWDHGYVKVSAVGLPPFNGAGGGAEVARENAVALAQKRLLQVLLELPVRERKLRDVLPGRPETREKLRALVSSAAVGGKSYSDGSVEITLTLATEGPAGLKAFLKGL
jgi:hypothetical protein